MASNSDFAGMAERSRADAFIAANTQECRKCKARNTPISKRTQLCGPCTEGKRQTMIDPAAAMPDRSVPIGETPEQGNRRLAKAMAERDAKKQRPTIGMLVLGAPGIPKATGALLNYCDQALSLRVNLADDLKRLNTAETFCICNPRSAAGRERYDAKWQRMDAYVARIAEVEGKIKALVPDVLVEPVVMPTRLFDDTLTQALEI